MRPTFGLLCVAFMLSPQAMLLSTASAAESDTIVLRAGETADLGPVFWVSNCRSALRSPPTAEVMEGPPQLSVSVKSQSVMARKQNCARPVEGGELSVTAAKDITSRLQGQLFIRVNYPTKDGDRQRGRTIGYTLFPADPAAGSAAAPPPASPKAP